MGLPALHIGWVITDELAVIRSQSRSVDCRRSLVGWPILSPSFASESITTFYIAIRTSDPLACRTPSAADVPIATRFGIQEFQGVSTAPEDDLRLLKRRTDNPKPVVVSTAHPTNTSNHESRVFRSAEVHFNRTEKIG